MFSTALVLFGAGLLTVLLPCILPLIPVVLGVSIAGKSRLRPLLTILGMVVSFVGFTFLLQVVLSQFVQVADYIRIATYVALLLFGMGFLTGRREFRYLAALAGGFFFLSKGPIAVIVAAAAGIAMVEIGTLVASRLQQLGSDVQQEVRGKLGADAPITAFVIGLTLGLVWVPCAGPALGFALTLVREKPGVEALLLLTCYALGTAVPLLIVGYGGQWAVHSVRSLNKYTGTIKHIAGVILILCAVAFQLDLFTAMQTYFVEHTGYGTLGTRIEEALFGNRIGGQPAQEPASPGGTLPDLGAAPEFTGLGPWFNSAPLTMAGLRGKVVLVDFWTYSCINCIRTLPYIQGYWDKYGSTALTAGKQSPFVVVGIHSPEFAFEGVASNVEENIKKRGLTYPIAMDNAFATWNAFQNQYWPAKYLIDAKGRVRYTHFGEGNYEQTDAAIASLLKEIGASAGTGTMLPETDHAARPVTPETYVSSRGWKSLENAKGSPGADVRDYASPAALALHHFALAGKWQLMDDEHQVLRSKTGEIRLHFLGGEANLVMGTESGKLVQASVSVDGGPAKAFTIAAHDLYTLYSGAYGEHEVTLSLTGEGAEAYAFTFGS